MALHRGARVLAAVVVTALLVTGLADPAAATGPSEGELLVSVDASGVLGNDASDSGVLSANGRIVAFVSMASNLVPGDTNQLGDVFVKNLWTGSTERVNVSTAGTESDGPVVGRPAISADGRYVAFASTATNLVLEDRNKQTDVFVHDRTTGVTLRVSVSAAGAEGNGASSQPAINGDGSVVAFMSKASNLVSGDANGQSDVFVRAPERLTPTTMRVSVSSGGVEGDGNSKDPSISGDGRFVTFTSSATNLVPADTNVAADIFLRDRTAATTGLVSVNLTNGPANGASANGRISADGSWIAFDSAASNLVSRDINGKRDVFARRSGNPRTELVSGDAYGRPLDRDSSEPTVSNIGIVAYTSDNAVFVRSNGTYTRGDGSAPAISADGFHLVFTSTSDSLAPYDTNDAADLFVSDYGWLGCTFSSGDQAACTVRPIGTLVPTSVRWSVNGVPDPSLDGLTSVQLTVPCQPHRHVEALVVSGGGIGRFGYGAYCFS